MSARESVPAYRCAVCGDRFASYGRWERHSDAVGHTLGWCELAAVAS